MNWQTKLLRVSMLGLLLVMNLASVCLADPLDEAKARLLSFIDKATNVFLALAVPAGGLAMTVLGVKRTLAKAVGDDETMKGSNSQLLGVAKWTAVAVGGGILAKIAASVFW